jgi:hypothetical protein
MPGSENGIEVDIIAVLGELSTVVEDPLEKEVKDVIVILI